MNKNQNRDIAKIIRDVIGMNLGPHIKISITQKQIDACWSVVDMLEKIPTTCEICTKAMNMGITAKDGLLYQNGKYIPLPAADIVAHCFGLGCAEQLVNHLSGKKIKE